MEIPFRKAPQGALPVPLMNITIQGTDITFEARLDTGADLSVIPEKYILFLQHNPNGDVNIRVADGSMRRERTYRVNIIVAGKCIYLDQVMTTESDVGLLGLDFLTYFDVMFVGSVMIIDPK